MELRRRLHHLGRAFSLVRSDTGIGGRQDKTTGMSLAIPWSTRMESGLDKWQKNSWVCRDVVNKPAEDMAIKWRVFDADEKNEPVAEALMEAEKRHMVRERVCEGIRQARHYGGALVCMITDEADLMTPLDVHRIKPGNLKNLHVVNRFRATPEEEIKDVTDPGYGRPEHYHIWEGWSDYRIHHSRVIRLDAFPMTRNSYSAGFGGDYRWSDSVLHAMLDEVERDLAMSQASGHMVLEGSIKVLKLRDLNQRRGGKTSGNETTRQSVEELLRQISRDISVFNTLVIADTTEADRLEAKIFSGVDALLEIQMQRVSGSTGIPATILWCRSPSGMNATGDSDNTIYQRLLSVIQWRMAGPALNKLDPVLAADEGLNRNQVENIPDYHWPTLTEKNALEEAQAFDTRVDGLTKLEQSGAIDANEIRRSVSGDAACGEFDGDAPEPDEDEDEVTRMQAELEALRGNNKTEE